MGASEAAAYVATAPGGGAKRLLLQQGTIRSYRTLTCGAEMAALLGASGYEGNSGWCSAAKQALSKREWGLPCKRTVLAQEGTRYTAAHTWLPVRLAAPPLPFSPPLLALPPQAPSRLSQLAVAPPPAAEDDDLEAAYADRPITSAVVQASSTSSVAVVSGLWAAINGIIAAASSTVGPTLLKVSFLNKLLHIWGGASAAGMQVLLEKLQLTGSGVHVAPPQMERYRQVLQSLAWASLSSASGSPCLKLGSACLSAALGSARGLHWLCIGNMLPDRVWGDLCTSKASSCSMVRLLVQTSWPTRADVLARTPWSSRPSTPSGPLDSCLSWAWSC
jgi:hypothetical protein